jgi:hypothetical protein
MPARGATYKEIWIAKLLSESVQPCVVVLERCVSLSDAIARERRWIRRALAEGHPLTNVVSNKTGRSQRDAMRGDVDGHEL